MSCILACARDAQIGLVCWQHHDRLADLLDPRNRGTDYNPARPDDAMVTASIPVLFAQLTLERARGGIGVVSTTGFRSGSPADDQVIVLRDERSRAEQLGPDDVERAPRPPLVVLRALTHRVVAERGALPGRVLVSVADHASWLYGALGWIVGQAWVGEVAQQLRECSASLRAALGDPTPAPVGTCRSIVNDAGEEDPAGPWRCAVPLYVPELPPRAPDEPIRLPSLRCPSCRHVYGPAELVALGHQQHAVAS